MASASFSRKRKRRTPRPVSPYVLSSLLDDVPISADDDNAQAEITCVEYWGLSFYKSKSRSVRAETK